MRIRLTIAAALLSASAPALVGAHVKWFTDPSPYPLRTDLILSERTALFAGAAALGLGILALVQRLLHDPHWPRLGFLRSMAIGAPTLLAVQSAVALVYAAVQPVLFVPNLPLQLNAVGIALSAVQLGIAFSLITGIADWLGAVALILLGPVAFLLFPSFDVLEQLLWAGIGVALLVTGRYAVDASRPRPWFRARTPVWSGRAVVALRVIVGISIVALALGEKIWNPDLGRAFLQERPHFNVPRSVLGLTWFSDDLFVLLAGLVEGTIGVLLISGLLTRVVILGMWLPFNLGIPFLPAQELIGHLPIFGSMYFLLVYNPLADEATGEPGAVPSRPGVMAGA